ncbi:MAG: NAD(P)-dependent oxidoreductase [Minwuiales bacterium]|nr:NAD(P)-dependent oxidoreductase [Minwuiales bacterium]
MNVVGTFAPGATELPYRWQSLAGKTLLVTGAAGFIGGALFQRLAGYGLDVIGTVLYPHEAETLRAAGHKAELLDLASEKSWDGLLDGVDIVFNIAAMFQETEQSDEAYRQVNHIGALKLAEAAARAGVKRFVHCSTVGVHGHVKEIPATELTPYNPMDVYHRTKLDGELAILDFGRGLADDGMVVTVNRPAMVYGPGDLRMLKLFKTIASGRFRMIGSGDTLAHLGYIDDQTDSFLLSATAPREAVHCEAFNIASDRPITLNDLAAEIARYSNVELARTHIPLGPVWLAGLICEGLCKPVSVKPPLSRRRVGFFTHDRAFDLSKARERLGYESHVDTATGVARTIQWYRENDFL